MALVHGASRPVEAEVPAQRATRAPHAAGAKEELIAGRGQRGVRPEDGERRPAGTSTAAPGASSGAAGTAVTTGSAVVGAGTTTPRQAACTTRATVGAGATCCSVASRDAIASGLHVGGVHSEHADAGAAGGSGRGRIPATAAGPTAATAATTVGVAAVVGTAAAGTAGTAAVATARRARTCIAQPKSSRNRATIAAGSVGPRDPRIAATTTTTLPARTTALDANPIVAVATGATTTWRYTIRRRRPCAATGRI